MSYQGINPVSSGALVRGNDMQAAQNDAIQLKREMTAHHGFNTTGANLGDHSKGIAYYTFSGQIPFISLPETPQFHLVFDTQETSIFTSGIWCCEISMVSLPIQAGSYGPHFRTYWPGTALPGYMVAGWSYQSAVRDYGYEPSGSGVGTNFSNRLYPDPPAPTVPDTAGGRNVFCTDSGSFLSKGVMAYMQLNAGAEIQVYIRDYYLDFSPNAFGYAGLMYRGTVYRIG